MTRRRRERTRGDLYEEVTARIIAQMEEGTVPWVQPWTAEEAGGPVLGLPQNAATRRAYSGINILLLWGAAQEQGRESQLWLTFKQALALGGAVRKGEKGTTIVYADRFTPESERQKAEESGEAAREVAFLKRYTVFHVNQCDGLPDDAVTSRASLSPRQIEPEAERLIQATGADVRVGGDRAYYVPSQDFIQVPPQAAFRDQINYYRTCFHELGHWTGHATRLARDLATRFGTKDYAREELVAEMASAFLCAEMGIVPTVRHADYLANWLAVLREDKRAIFRAASLASKAADFVLSFRTQQETDQRAA
ncbi:ArdC family protein [Parvularcula oceani]|uniref:ArdC family protein n=1 Tax=Parvularcula oceani TaxID=1247963 RepID=UPI0004E14FA6|nr:zincin-like metallopeptidase domain-containing protein [Parvularcula oceani]